MASRDPVTPRLLLLGLLVLAAGCGILEGRDCTTEPVPGIVVTIVDAGTGLPLAEGAEGVVRDGEFQDSLRAYSFNRASEMVSRASAWERRGTYAIVVGHPGYDLWVRDRVRVDDGECHVRKVELTAELVRVPER